MLHWFILREVSLLKCVQEDVDASMSNRLNIDSKRDCTQELHSSDLTICRGKMWNNAYNHSGERRRVQPLCLTCFESYDSTRGKKFRANDFRTIYYLLSSFQ